MDLTTNTLPLDTIRTSLWMQEALGDEPDLTTEALSGDLRTDVCIVGGGYTGLWTALAIQDRDPSVDVTLIEANICGAGASGVNGGFAMTWWPKWGTLTRLVGSDAAAVARASEVAVAEIGAFAADNEIDAHYTKAGWLWAATNSAQVGSWHDTVAGWSASGQSPYRSVDGEEAARMTGSATHLGGVFETGVATLHPAKLARGLRRVAMARGIRVLERTPMTSLKRQGSRARVGTPNGNIVADQVVLATNSALVAHREIRKHLVVLGSDVVATAPCGPEIADWEPGLAISDSRRLVHYYRTTRDGRVVFGKGGGRVGFGSAVSPEFWGPSSRARAVTAHLRRTFPRLRSTPVTHSWSGAVDYSSDAMPFFGSLAHMPNVHYVAGYSGDGVGPARLAGHVLASHALESDDEWARFPLIRRPGMTLPPEPFRYVGGHVVRRAIMAKEAAEDRGRRPNPVFVALSKLDPTSFVG